MNHLRLLIALDLITIAAALCGCTHHTIDVQPIRVEPIHMTVDVNLKVDRELDRFFDFEEKVPATQPSSKPSAAPISSSQGES